MSIESYNLKKAVHIAFAENLKKARIIKGWTQASAATRLKVKLATYQAYEEARSCPPVYALLSLAKVFGIVDLASFLSSPDGSEQICVETETTNVPATVLEQKYREAGIREKLAVNILLGLVDLE